jgi:hypothetical protein
MFEVYRGQRPGRPDNTQCFVELNDVVWGVITQAWAQDPLARPNMDHIHDLLCQALPLNDPPARQVPRDCGDEPVLHLDHLRHQQELILKQRVCTRDSEVPYTEVMSVHSSFNGGSNLANAVFQLHC